MINFREWLQYQEDAAAVAARRLDAMRGPNGERVPQSLDAYRRKDYDTTPQGNSDQESDPWQIAMMNRAKYRPPVAERLPDPIDKSQEIDDRVRNPWPDAADIDKFKPKRKWPKGSFDAMNRVMKPGRSKTGDPLLYNRSPEQGGYTPSPEEEQQIIQLKKQGVATPEGISLKMADLAAQTGNTVGKQSIPPETIQSILRKYEMS